MCRRHDRARDRAVAKASRRRAAAVAEDAGSLCPRCQTVPGLPRRAPRQAGDAEEFCRDRAQRRARLHGDAAVMALLYGSGLRISEALGLKRRDVPRPGEGDVLIVTGKGNKARMVPVLQNVLQLIEDYAAICPYSLSPNGPVFVGARGGPL